MHLVTLCQDMWHTCVLKRIKKLVINLGLVTFPITVLFYFQAIKVITLLFSLWDNTHQHHKDKSSPWLLAILFIGIWILTFGIFFATLFINSLLQQQQHTATDRGMNYNYLCFQWPSPLCLCILSPSVSQTFLVGASCSATICPLILSAALRLCSSVHSTAVPNVSLSVVLTSLLTPYLVFLYSGFFFFWK